MNKLVLGLARSRPSHIASARLDSPLQRLIQTLSYQAYARGDMRFEQLVNLLHQTPASLALLLKQEFDQAWIRPACQTQVPDQYGVFRLFSRSAKILTFNFEGFAEAFCRQEVIPVQGSYFRGTPLSDDDMIRIHAYTQLFDESDGKRRIGPVILPPEEASAPMAPTRERVFQRLLKATVVVVVGYRFGIGAVPEYDRVYRDLFVEAMRYNPCAIHLIDPGSVDLRTAIEEEIDRHTNLFSWPLYWNIFAKALLDVGGEVGARSVLQLTQHCKAVSRRYYEVDALNQLSRIARRAGQTPRSSKS